MGAPSLLLSFVLPSVSFCSSSPISAQIARVGVDGFAVYPDPFFLRSSLPSFVFSFLSLFLALLRGDPVAAGFVYT